jgi:hypothetical protein
MSTPADDRKHWLEPPEWWKKSKPLRWVPILVGLAIVLPGLWVAKETIAPSAHRETQHFTEVAADPVKMLADLQSYDTVESVRAKLDAAKVQYTVTPVRPAPSSKYPPRNTDTIVATGYRHLGIPGQLTLEFFNDRLYEAAFVPAELEDYIEKLHAADKRLKRERTGRAEVIVGNLRIASNVDFAATDVGYSLGTKPFVIWQDQRLLAQLNDWDKRFIAMPGKTPG